MTTTSAPTAWSGVLDDQVASAMIDHGVHHAGALTLKGSSYRLRPHRLIAGSGSVDA